MKNAYLIRNFAVLLLILGGNCKLRNTFSRLALNGNTNGQTVIAGKGIRAIGA